MVMVRMFFVVVLTVFSSGSVLNAAPWQQTFYESEVGSFDTMEMFMKDGVVSFTALDTITDETWTETVLPDYAKTTGDQTSEPYFYFTMGFSDRTPFVFNFYAFLNNTLLEGARLSYANCSWNITPMDIEVAHTQYSVDYANVSPVPEPATALLFGTGIATLGFVGRRKK